MINFPGLSVKVILKILKQLQLLYHQIQSVWGRVCVWPSWQPWVFWSMSPFYSSAPSQKGNPGEDALVFMSLLPHGKSFQPNFLNLALLYYGKCAEAACKCHLPSNWWCQGPSKKNSTVAWNHSKSRWETGLCCRQGQPCLPAEEPDFFSWIPSWHPTEGSCPYEVGQAWPLDHPLSLVHSKPRNKALLKVQPCPNIARFLLFLVWFIF